MSCCRENMRSLGWLSAGGTALTFFLNFHGFSGFVMSVNRVIELSSVEMLVKEYKRCSHPHLEVPETSVEEFVRRRPTETVIIRGGRIIEYHEGYEELSKSFESEEELLRSFKGNKFADAAFPGYRYDQLYPKPQKTNYYKLNFGLKKKDIVFPVMLANEVGFYWLARGF